MLETKSLRHPEKMGPKTQVEGFGFNKKRDTDTMPVLQGNESFGLIISASQ